VQQWQKAEDDFDDYFKRKGKRAFVFKFPDAAEIFGRVGKIGQTRAVPSDRIVTCDGETFYAEVKSTEDPLRFKRSLLRKSQSAFATQIIAAGGQYLVFVKALVTSRWYVMPYSIASASPSLLWSDMEAYKWTK
jgi:hypothetical protein